MGSMRDPSRGILTLTLPSSARMRPLRRKRGERECSGQGREQIDAPLGESDQIRLNQTSCGRNQGRVQVGDGARPHPGPPLALSPRRGNRSALQGESDQIRPNQTSCGRNLGRMQVGDGARAHHEPPSRKGPPLPDPLLHKCVEEREMKRRVWVHGESDQIRLNQTSCGRNQGRVQVGHGARPHLVPLPQERE